MPWRVFKAVLGHPGGILAGFAEMLQMTGVCTGCSAITAWGSILLATDEVLQREGEARAR